MHDCEQTQDNLVTDPLEALVPDPVLRRILLARGVNNADTLNCALSGILHYSGLQDIEAAAQTVAEAVMQNRPVIIVGDYDVDGLCGTAIGVLALQSFGLPQVSYIIPSRYQGGYGITPADVQTAAGRGAELIITVDNGISAIEAAQKAADLGVRLLITDHHDPAETLPQAVAVVDPKRRDDSFGSKNLCGAGVLFYVLAASRARLMKQGWFTDARPCPALEPLLDLVAAATIGDVVSLDLNNRRLVRAGIRRLQNGKGRAGLMALLEICGIPCESVRARDIAFSLCPRLNAPGRLRIDDCPSIELLLCDDRERALKLAGRLDMCNLRRGDFERVMIAQAMEDIAQSGPGAGVTLYHPQWLPGVAGLVAGRLRGALGRPVFVFAGDGEVITGSGRAPEGYALPGILGQIARRHPNLLVRSGGHAQAAGASLRQQDLPEFAEAFAAECALCTAADAGSSGTDGSLPGDRLNLDFARRLDDLGPFGPGFLAPVFEDEFTLRNAVKISESAFRLSFEHDDGHRLQAMFFNAGRVDQQSDLQSGARYRVRYEMYIDHYRGSERMQIRAEALEPL